MAGPDFRISLGYRGVRPTADVVRVPRPTARVVVEGDPLALLTERLVRQAARDTYTSEPAGVARRDWALSAAPQEDIEDIYDPIPAHPGIRHHTPRTSTFVAGHVHGLREIGKTPPPSTPQRIAAAHAGLLTPSELLGPLTTMYADATERLLTGGVRILFSPNGSERTLRGTMKPRPPVLSGGRFDSARKLITLHTVATVDPAFSLAQIIDYLRFMTDAHALGDRFSVVFPPWREISEHTRTQVRYAWTLCQVYADGLRHADNLRTRGYTVDRQPWNTWLTNPEAAKVAIYEDVLESCGLAGESWSADLLRAIHKYPLRTIRDSKVLGVR